MKYLYSLLILLGPIYVFSQLYQGSVNEDYSFSVKKRTKELSTPRNNPQTFTQLEGFPKAFLADPNNKNFRNVTLADINQDGEQEILFTASNRLIVLKNSEILWSRAMTGTGIYPPTVADMDNDGDLEIVQVTGGNQKKGRVYLLDHEGNNMEGFPNSYNDNWILTGATVSDLDGDEQLEIIFSERNAPGGNVHVITNKGEPWSRNWPIRLPNTPAMTPTIGDIDNDGQKEIVLATTAAIFAFNLEAEVEPGWPVDDPDTRFSFQSPVLVDLDNDNTLEIVGAAHGNHPEYFILNHDGSPYGVWPFTVPENTRSLATPTVVTINGEKQILMGRPVGEEEKDMLYSWNEAGDLKDGFPIFNTGGLEGGVISVADIDADEDMEVIFGSNLREANGKSFINAFNMDGTKVEGFPLRPFGWTLLNGAAIGDINADGKMDLTALTYSLEFGAKPDSIFINVYDLDVPYAPEKVLWSTFKGSNSREGNIEANLVSSIYAPKLTGVNLEIYPNPVLNDGKIAISVEQEVTLLGNIISISGQKIANLFDQNLQTGTHLFDIPNLPAGTYFINVNDKQNRQQSTKLIIQKK